jgi:hypothetical protein
MDFSALLVAVRIGVTVFPFPGDVLPLLAT